MVKLPFVFVTPALSTLLSFPRLLGQIAKHDILVKTKMKDFQGTWTFAFLAGTIFLSWTITVFATIFRGRRITISFPKLQTSTTRYTASWIIRPFPKFTIYRAWLDKTFTCFSPDTSTICPSICWSWAVTFSGTVLKSTTARLRAFRVFWPFPKFPINWYLKWTKMKSTLFRSLPKDSKLYTHCSF